MFRKIVFSTIAVLVLAACSGADVSLPNTTPLVRPSAPPSILSPTPPFAPSVTSSPTVRIFTATPTIVFTKTASPTPSVTVPPPMVTLDILGCNTSLDILHGMGEVTNAYPILRNQTDVELKNLCATLSASDEARQHPDKSACVTALQAGYQVTLKLTVDTGFKQDTSIRVDVSNRQGYTTFLVRPSCKDIGMPGWVPDEVGKIQPIP